MNRNADFKKTSLKFADSKTARAKRVDELNDTRRLNRLAKSNAQRGLVEIDQNTVNLNIAPDANPVEITHEQKLKERLARLKQWRELKVAEEKKAKANKKTPFLVPGIARSEKMTTEATNSKPAKSTLSGRVTRSQVKKNGDTEIKQWTVTDIKQPTAKKTAKQPVKATKSFAPKDFIFSAPFVPLEAPLKVAGNDTPQRQKPSELEDESVKISPLLTNNPWITTSRGSSSKKQQRMSMEAAASAGDPHASPFLKKRAASLIPVQVNPDALHFRSLMSSEGSRLNDLCAGWEELLSAEQVPEEESGSVRTVIGQSQLLQRERFNQFAGLIHQFETNTGEKEITRTDLEGFWEMIYIQVCDVDKKFEALTRLKANNWIKSKTPIRVKKPRAAAKKKETAPSDDSVPTKPAAAARSNMRAYIAAARKNKLAAKSPGSSSPLSRRSSLLMSPIRTPGKRQSLRRSVLLSSAKKPIFTVTDIASQISDERVDDSKETFSLTPRRKSNKLQVVEQGNATVSDNEFPVQNVTPNQKKTGETNQFDDSANTTAADDKLEPEGLDKATPLKVFRTPNRVVRTRRASGASIAKLDQDAETDKDESSSNSDASSVDRPRRSTRIRNPSTSSGRVSLLPTTVVSPSTPKENLIEFE